MIELTPEEQHIILEKGTEAPFSGEYVDTTTAGTYRPHTMKQDTILLKTGELLASRTQKSSV